MVDPDRQQFPIIKLEENISAECSLGIPCPSGKYSNILASLPFAILSSSPLPVFSTLQATVFPRHRAKSSIDPSSLFAPAPCNKATNYILLLEFRHLLPFSKGNVWDAADGERPPTSRRQQFSHPGQQNVMKTEADGISFWFQNYIRFNWHEQAGARLCTSPVRLALLWPVYVFILITASINLCLNVRFNDPIGVRTGFVSRYGFWSSAI